MLNLWKDSSRRRRRARFAQAYGGKRNFASSITLTGTSPFFPLEFGSHMPHVPLWKGTSLSPQSAAAVTTVLLISEGGPVSLSSLILTGEMQSRCGGSLPDPMIYLFCEVTVVLLYGSSARDC
jgi:hypothetical protein